MRDFGGWSSAQLASMTDSHALDKWHDLEQGLVLFFYVSMLVSFQFPKKFFCRYLNVFIEASPNPAGLGLTVFGR